MISAIRAWLLLGIPLALTINADCQTSSITIDAFKHSDPKFEIIVQVDLTNIPGATGVDAVTASGMTQALAPFFGSQYAITIGPYPDFASFLSAIDGSWLIRIHFGASGSAVYKVVASGFGSPAVDLFPPVPTMISPSDGAIGVHPTPTFTWDNGGTHTGALESLFLNLWHVADPTIGELTSSGGGSLSLNATSWTPTVVLPPGEATLLVQYETNQAEDDHVSLPVFMPAESSVANPGISWDSHSGDLFSRDLISFTIAPLEIVAIARSAEGVKITIDAPIGMRVRIEYSPSLRARTWTGIGEATMSGGSGTFTDTDPARLRRADGFYRAVEVPVVIAK